MSRLITVLIIVLAVILPFSSCATNNNTAANPGTNPGRGNSRGNVWDLLSAGDERAMGFFLGEVNVHATDPRGRTPLHFAAEQNDPALAAFFITLGADVNAADNSGQTPLGASVENNSAAAARIIAAAAGIDIHQPARNGLSPAVMALLQDNGFVENILTPATLNSADNDGKTVLHIASDMGNVEGVKTILAAIDSAEGTARILAAAGTRNNAIDRRDNAGRNPLDIAYSHPQSRQHFEVAEQLILSGAISENPVNFYFSPAVRNANFDLRRADGLAPLHFAARIGYEGLISFLADKVSDINIQTPSGSTPLHEAVRSGNTRAIRLLLDKGAEINAQDARGNSALHITPPQGNHSAIIQLLLSNGANPNLRDEHGASPLHVLVTLNRSPEIVRTLLAGDVDVSGRDINGQTPLFLAVQENRVRLIPLLLSHGSDIFAADNAGVTPFGMAVSSRGPVLDALITNETAQQIDSAGNTMLHKAIANFADTEIIGRILSHNANVNARNRDGETPLHIAVQSDQREAGEFILANGADIFPSNSAGHSPLYLALSRPSGLVRWLFNSRTIQSHDGLGNTMLHFVALWRMDHHIPFITQQGISTEVQNATGETPLFWAVNHDGAATIRTLLREGANLHARDSLGNSALHSAVRWNARNSVNALLDAGIDVNSHNLNGTTPLHDSVRLGLTDTATILINRRANLEVRDANGNTPFMEAVRAGFVNTAELLSRRGAFVMTRNANGDTPLHLAVMREDAPSIRLLTGLNASIHARNTRNRTPFQIALTDSPLALSLLLTGNRINTPDDFGNSPLHIALQEGVPSSIVRTIIEKGSHLTTVDSNGRIPLRLAVDLSAWDSARVLADAGSDPFFIAVDNRTSGEIAIIRGNDAIRALFSGMAINARDPSGNTVLHYAARVGSPEAISLLLELGANKDVRNISEERPVDIAMRWNHRENIALLN